MFDKIFENKSEYKYFQKLYQMFIDTKNSPRVLVDEYFNKVSTLVKNSIEELNIEKLQKVSDSIFEELNKVKNGNE
jgi:flagellar hook-associated protein FlgK